MPNNEQRSTFFYRVEKDYASPITGYSLKQGDIISGVCRMLYFPETGPGDFSFIGACTTLYPVNMEFINNLRRPGTYPEILPFKEYL